MAHDWQSISTMAERGAMGFHAFDRVRRCSLCGAIQKQETLYDFGTYSNRGGPKVRGTTWVPLVGRCNPGASQVR